MTVVSRTVSLYDSLKRKKLPFEPVTPGRVGMYVCGPTVYGDPHLGHARGAVTFDVVYRLFCYLGYKVRYVRNITDVGHLEDEVAGAGEDKIAKKARLEQLEPMEIAQYYTNRYRNFMQMLNVLQPGIEPVASGHIPEQIQIIKDILAKNLAYEVNGSVYFDLDNYRKQYAYGELSGKIPEEMLTGSRDTEGLNEKKGQHDFALWKKAGPEHIMQWDSPWGKGFPGWHLECTAMSKKYLGFPFDIHGGGMDLQFPHHEAEIAQSHGCCGHEPANYWLHNNMLTINGQKMAKSLGNFINLEQLFTGNHPMLVQGYSPMTIRFFMLQAHYRSPLDFSNEALQAAEKGYKRLMNAYAALMKLQPTEGKTDVEKDKAVKEVLTTAMDCMCDDFNTAQALAALFEIVPVINDMDNGKLPVSTLASSTLEEAQRVFSGLVNEVFGLTDESTAGNQNEKLSAAVNLLITLRKKARDEKNWALSDQIRDELKAAGILLKDDKNGGTSFVLE